MTDSTPVVSPPSDHCQPVAYATGSVCLPNFEVLSLRPVESGTLYITSGRIWVTMDTLTDDYILTAPASVRIPPESHIVLEAWCPSHEQDAYFYWRAD